MFTCDLLDLFLIMVVAVFAFRGYFRGMIQPLVSLLAVVVAGCSARLATPWLAPWLTFLQPERIRQASAFLISFIVSALLLALATRYVRKSMYKGGLGSLDRLVGATLNVVKACTLLSFLLAPVQAYSGLGQPLRQSIVFPGLQFVGFAAKLVLPGFGPFDPVVTPSPGASITVWSRVEPGGKMFRRIEISAPDRLFLNAMTSQPAGERGWQTEYASDGPGRHKLVCSAQIGVDCPPTRWPFPVAWSVQRGLLWHRFSYRDQVEVAGLLDAAEQVYNPQTQPSETVTQTFSREWRAFLDAFHQRLDLRLLKSEPINVVVELEAPWRLHDATGPQGIVTGHKARWAFTTSYGEKVDVAADGVHLGWLSWTLVILVFCGIAVIGTDRIVGVIRKLRHPRRRSRVSVGHPRPGDKTASHAVLPGVRGE